MSSPESPAEPALNVGMDQLRPEAITSEGLPVGMRGYDRERVDRLLSRASEAYRQLWRQRDALRERLGSLEAELEAAEGEARVSAKSVAELVQRSSTAENELAEMQAARDELAERFARVEAERKQAVAELRETTERAAVLGQRVQAFEEALRNRPEMAVEKPRRASVAPPPSTVSRPDSEAEAAQLMLTAARASEELREAARRQAGNAMRKVRARAAAIAAEAEREQVVLAEMQERRRLAEREAEEILAEARVEAERVAAAIGEERDRVRTLLTGALASLDAASEEPPEGLVADLSSRLRDSGVADDADASASQALDPHA